MKARTPSTSGMISPVHSDMALDVVLGMDPIEEGRVKKVHQQVPSLRGRLSVLLSIQTRPQ